MQNREVKKATYRLIHDIDVDVSNDAYLDIESDTPVLKLDLKNKLSEINKKIDKVDNIISDINMEDGVDACCAVLTIFAGAATFAAGINNINHGNLGIGGLEAIGGYLLLDAGMDDLGDVAKRDTHDQESGLSLSQLHSIRDHLKNERTQLRIQLYNVEKEETLEVLNKRIQPQSPFHIAVTKQFEAIDQEIKEEKFSKAYIDVAINTRKMIKAETPKDRERYAEKHVAIGAKESVSKVVVGSLLLVASVAIVLTAAVLTGVFWEVGPALWFGAGLCMLGGMMIGALGISLIKSGLGQKSTPLLRQSLFNVAHTAKAESNKIIYSYQYN